MEEKRLNEEEVDLRDYLKVMGKRKWLIIIGTLFCIIVTGIISFRMPKVYEVSTSIKIGKIEDRFVEEGLVISTKMKSISLKKEIAEELSLPFEEMRKKKFKISTEGDKNSLIITTKMETDKPEQEIKILEAINQTILRKHRNKIENAKKELLETIVINENLVKIKEQQQKSLEKRLTDIKREIKELEKIRDRIIKGKIEKADVVGMIAYFNDFQVRLNSLYDTQSQIGDKIPSEIQSYRGNIVTLQGKLGKISETEVINPPYSSYSPIRPRKKVNVAIATLFGLIVFLFIAFLQEYLSKTE